MKPSLGGVILSPQYNSDDNCLIVPEITGFDGSNLSFKLGNNQVNVELTSKIFGDFQGIYSYDLKEDPILFANMGDDENLVLRPHIFHDNSLFGIGIFYCHLNPHTSRYGNIHHRFIEKEYRGKQLGRRAFEICENFLATRDVKAIAVKTELNGIQFEAFRKFLEKRSYLQVKSDEGDENGSIKFEKKLEKLDKTKDPFRYSNFIARIGDNLVDVSIPLKR